MKRLLGLIGLIYLFVLAVVFYCYSAAILWTVVILSVSATVAGLFFKVIKSRCKIYNYIIAVGITSLCAVISVILYTNIVYLPAINDYSDKELSVSGYVCDEVQRTETSFSCTILADKINGGDANIKIGLVSYSDQRLEDFDRIKATIKPGTNENDYMKSKGIFLSVYDGDFEIEKTGEKQFSPYACAVAVRKTLKNSLDSLLSDNPSSLCKAVLLGDKKALSYDVKNSFTKTGTSFLIVVSGMHLAIATGFILFIFKRFVKNKVVLSLIALITVFAYCAVTGFTPSVMRSGIMVAMTYIGSVFFRQSESINSLGVAALALTLLNPYAVGDIGMLLSFSATLGIVLWSRPLSDYVSSKLRIKHKFPRAIVGMLSVSVSASLWIMPIVILEFGRISPLVVLISFICEPLVSALLICALVASVLYVCPVISFFAYPFGLAAGVIGRLTVFIVSFFGNIPFCSVNADKPYFYVWLALTSVLVIVGYSAKAKPFYVKSSVAFSLSTLILGWAVFAIISYNTTTLGVYYSGGGVTAAVTNGYNATLISCGGANGSKDDVIESISKDITSLDNIIIPNQKNKYSKYLPDLLGEFDVSNVLVYDKDSNTQAMLEEYDGKKRTTFGDGISFSLFINSDTADTVYTFDGNTVQYLDSNKTTMLFVPSGADVSKLPDKVRSADYLLTDGLPDNYELLDCGTVIYSGKDEKFKETEDELSLISEDIITVFSGKIKINF